MEKSESRRNRIGGISKNQMAGLYDLEETIGEGHYAVVKLARHVFTGEKVAVKVRRQVHLNRIRLGLNEFFWKFLVVFH